MGHTNDCARSELRWLWGGLLGGLFFLGGRTAYAAGESRATDSTQYGGHYALTVGAPMTTAELHVKAEGSPLITHLSLEQFPLGSYQRIRSYVVEMTKPMHLIVVSADLQTFAHIHPLLDTTGVFSIDLRVPHSGMYYLYADDEPEGFGHQVFRFDVPMGRATPSTPHLGDDTATQVHTGPYIVSLGEHVLAAGRESILSVHIRKHGRPATDLHPYLGQLAHAVIINPRGLSYVHVHAMPETSMDHSDGMNSMAGMADMHMTMPSYDDTATVPADLRLHVRLPDAGPYRLWLQFRNDSHLYVAPFVITAR